jgi:hypothetical protein
MKTLEAASVQDDCMRVRGFKVNPKMTPPVNHYPMKVQSLAG